MILGREPIRRHWKNKPRRGPLRDRRLREFIRQHPCAVCGTLRNVECAHTGPHGLGVKSGDDTGIPLCFWDHQGSNESLHALGPERFQKLHGLKIGALVKELNAEWRELNQRRKLT